MQGVHSNAEEGANFAMRTFPFDTLPAAKVKIVLGRWVAAASHQRQDVARGCPLIVLVRTLVQRIDIELAVLRDLPCTKSGSLSAPILSQAVCPAFDLCFTLYLSRASVGCVKSCRLNIVSRRQIVANAWWYMCAPPQAEVLGSASAVGIHQSRRSRPSSRQQPPASANQEHHMPHLSRWHSSAAVPAGKRSCR